jgi:anthranilate/para-aminobenzoate synthase component I
VLYERAGFAKPLRDDQRRFRTSVEQVWQAATTIADARRPLIGAGLALHSLRAASAESIAALVRKAEGFPGPIHIHVAEQAAEVDDCLATTGARPIEWLARERLLDRRWQLVHATHSVPEEIDAVRLSGAGVVLCPSTEANLGDGLADVPGWLAAHAGEGPAPAIGPMQPQITTGAYIAAFDRLQEAIRAGDIYQANFTMPMAGATRGDPLALYAAIRPAGNAGYGGVIFDGSHWLLSCSPELFFTLKGRAATRWRSTPRSGPKPAPATAG